MGTFAETVNIDYHLSFVGQGKQTSVFHFCFHQRTKVDCFRFPFAAYKRSSVFHIYIYICRYTAVSNGKWKPRRFSLIQLPFAHHTNIGLLFVCLLTKKRYRSYPFANGQNGLAHLCLDLYLYIPIPILIPEPIFVYVYLYIRHGSTDDTK